MVDRHLAYDGTTGHLVYSPASGHLAYNCSPLGGVCGLPRILHVVVSMSPSPFCSPMCHGVGGAMDLTMTGSGPIYTWSGTVGGIVVTITCNTDNDTTTLGVGNSYCIGSNPGAVLGVNTVSYGCPGHPFAGTFTVTLS